MAEREVEGAPECMLDVPARAEHLASGKKEEVEGVMGVETTGAAF